MSNKEKMPIFILFYQHSIKSLVKEIESIIMGKEEIKSPVW